MIPESNTPAEALKALKDAPDEIARAIVETLPHRTVSAINTALARHCVLEAIRRDDRAERKRAGT